jgi:flagellar M-ring protein FliF
VNDLVTDNLRRVRELLRAFTPGQIAVLSFGVVVLVIGGVVFARSTAPPNAPLFSNLSSSDAVAITQQLDSMGIAYQLENGGTQILTAPDKVNATRLALSGKGLPSASRDGYALLDKQGITTSEFMQDVTYQRAIEGELATTVEAIDGVASATVHLAIPEKSVFTQASDVPSASVLVTMRAGATMDEGQVQAVTNLVASSIPRLKASDVTVADSSGQLLTGVPGALGGAAAAGSARVEGQRALDAQTMLDRVLGAGKSVVRVHADLDFDQRATTTQTYTYPRVLPPLTSSTSSEIYKGSGAAPGGVLGSGSIGTVPGATSTSGTNYTKSTDTRTSAVDGVVEQRTGAPGAVKRLTVAVMVDSALTGVDPGKLSSLIANAVGLDSQRGDTIQLEFIPFDHTAQDAAAQAAQQADAAQGRAQTFDLVRKGGIGLLVLAVVALAVLSGRRQRRSLLDVHALEAMDRGTYPPVLDRADAHEMIAVEGGADPHAAARIQARRSEQSQAEIGDLVSRQPEEVAQLLRGWMSDRR